MTHDRESSVQRQIREREEAGRLIARPVMANKSTNWLESTHMVVVVMVVVVVVVVMDLSRR